MPRFRLRQVSLYFLFFNVCNCWSRWPRGLSRSSAAAHLLRLWVRIPPGAWMSTVSVVCCQVEVSATGRSLVQRSPADCGASLCVIQETLAHVEPLRPKNCNYCGHRIFNTDVRSLGVQEGYSVWGDQNECCCQLSTIELHQRFIYYLIHQRLFGWHCVPKPLYAQLILFSST